MKRRVEELMNEALRRYFTFHVGEPLSTAWLGLGTEAVYRPLIEDGLMSFIDGRTPPKRCMGWLHLTRKGEGVFLTMLSKILRKTFEQGSLRDGYCFPNLDNYKIMWYNIVNRK